MRYLKISLIVFSVFVIVSCGDEPGLTEEEKLIKAREEVLTKITESVWEPSSIFREGEDITGDYEGLKIELKEGTFQTINGGQAWPDSGTWQFVEGESNQLTRDDGVVMTVEITGDEVKISFTFEEEVFVGGKSKTVQAFIAFILKKFAGLFGS